MSSFLSSSSLLVLAPASSASTSISVTLSGSLFDTFCVGSEDCFSDETLEEAEGGGSVLAGADLSELCTCREVTADVCVVETGGAV